MHILFFACVGNGQNHAATVVGNGPKSDITGKANLTERVFRLKFFLKKFCGFCPVNIQPFTKIAACTPMQRQRFNYLYINILQTIFCQFLDMP
jgi:hypothetical protein